MDLNKRYAILVVDMLNDFVYGKLGFSKINKIIPNIKLLIDSGREFRIPIIYCNDSHSSSDRELKIWGPHAMKGTKGSQVIKELRPQPQDHVILKNTYSAFHNTNLKNTLDGLYNGKGVEEIILTGIHTDICIKHTVYDAFLHGYDIILAENGVCSATIQKHKGGLDYMKGTYSIRVQKIKNILDDFNKERET